MIEQGFILCLLVSCIHYVMQEGQIFAKLGFWLKNHLPEAIHNPVFNCPICMCPWYGSILYWLIFGESVKMWVIVVFIAMGFMIVILQLTPSEYVQDESD